MNKKELVAHVATQAGINQGVALTTIDAVFHVLKEHLHKGGSIALRGFGTFTVKEHAERRGINPITLEPIIIPARKVIKFIPSKSK